jgi:hypothetical protein
MKKISKKWYGLTLLLLLFLPIKFLNHSGFCYSKMSYLSERELIDIHLFGKEAEYISFDEKVKTLKEREGIEYPYGCIVIDNMNIKMSWDEKLYQLIFGKKDYGLNCLKVTVNDKSNNIRYSNVIKNITSCGSGGFDPFGEEISKESYNAGIKNSTQHWEGMQK